MPITNVIDDYFDNIVFSGKEEFEAFEWIITKGVGKQLMAEKGMSEEDLDNYMADINITVRFNRKNESILTRCDKFQQADEESINRFGVLGY